MDKMTRNALGKLKNLTLLIAEDDTIIREQNAQTLKIFFKDVFSAKDGLQALHMYEEEKPDMMLIDMNMPKMNGLEFISKVRLADYETPIIILSAYSDADILLQAINLSIDGYFLKPLKLDELIATCCKSVDRRRLNEVKDIVSFDNELFYHTATRELYQGGVKVDMGYKERALLDLLLQANGGVVSKDDISSELYPLEEITDSACKNLLSRLRKKIGEDRIINVKNAGWKLRL